MTSQARAINNGPATGNMISDSALGLVRETLKPYLDLNTKIWTEGPLGPAEIEIARLRNARTVNCVFCKNVRYDIAVQAGLDEDKVDMINDEYENSALSAREKLIVALTDQYLSNPGAIGTALKMKLQAQFSAAELVHLSMAIAHFNGFSRCAVAIGGMPDSLPTMQISLPQ